MLAEAYSPLNLFCPAVSFPVSHMTRQKTIDTSPPIFVTSLGGRAWAAPAIPADAPPSAPSLCPPRQVRLCLLCVGTSLVFGPLLGKSWRLYKVFTQRVPDKRVVSTQHPAEGGGRVPRRGER